MRTRTVYGSAAAALLLLAGNASAALITSGGLTLDTDPADIYQQTSASPCVIGGSNCQNPAGFAFTAAPTGGSGQDRVRTSPLYTLAQIEGVLGTTSFFVGLDYNQASAPQNLQVFSASYFVDGSLISAQIFNELTSLPTNNNGVGFSDFLMTGFVIPNNANQIQFHAEWFQNNGADRFFLIAGDDNGTVPVSEPSVVLLLGLGLLSMVAARRRLPGSAR